MAAICYSNSHYNKPNSIILHILMSVYYKPHLHYYVIYFLVKGEDCKETEIIEGRLGTELLMKFSLSDLRDEYNKYIIEKKTNENEIEIQNLKVQSQIKFQDKMDSLIFKTIYKNGKPTHLAGSLTEIFMTNYTLVVKKTKLQNEDAGIYWMDFRLRRFGHKALIIPGKPTIIGRSPSNPVLKPEHNYISTIQLECHSVSTSVGDCLPTLYIVWYKNGMRITDVDPTLSQINVTVDQNGGQFTCLATDYPPCYQRLQTTKHYDVLSIEECNDVLKSETFIIIPEFEPLDVKLEPDQRVITVNTNEVLKVNCSAKCNPKCNVRWEKDYQGFESNGLFNLTENLFENDLVIENVNSSYKGIYICLVNNTHGEVKKNFTLNVRETKDKALLYGEMNNVIVAVTAVIVIVIVLVIIVVIIVFIVTTYKKYRREKYLPHRNEELEESLPDYGIYESVIDLHQDESLPGLSTDNDSRNGEPGIPTDNDSRNGEPGTPTDNNSRNSEQNTNLESHTYDALALNTSNGNRNPDPESGYTRLFKVMVLESTEEGNAE